MTSNLSVIFLLLSLCFVSAGRLYVCVFFILSLCFVHITCLGMYSWLVFLKVCPKRLYKTRKEGKELGSGYPHCWRQLQYMITETWSPHERHPSNKMTKLVNHTLQKYIRQLSEYLLLQELPTNNKHQCH